MKSSITPRTPTTPSVAGPLNGRVLLPSVPAGACFQRVCPSTFSARIVASGCWAYPEWWGAVCWRLSLARRGLAGCDQGPGGSDVLLAHGGGAGARTNRSHARRGRRSVAAQPHLAERVEAPLGRVQLFTPVLSNGVDAALFHPAPKGPAREAPSVCHAIRRAAPSTCSWALGFRQWASTVASSRRRRCSAGAGSSFHLTRFVAQGGSQGPSKAASGSGSGGARVRSFGACSLRKLPVVPRGRPLLVPAETTSGGRAHVLGLKARACGTPFFCRQCCSVVLPEIFPPGRRLVAARQWQRHWPPGGRPGVSLHESRAGDDPILARGVG